MDYNMVTLGILATALLALLPISIVSSQHKAAIRDRNPDAAQLYLLLQIRLILVAVTSVMMASIVHLANEQLLGVWDRDFTNAISMVAAWFPAVVFGVMYVFLSVYGVEIITPWNINRRCDNLMNQMRPSKAITILAGALMLAPFIVWIFGQWPIEELNMVAANHPGWHFGLSMLWLGAAIYTIWFCLARK